MTYHDMDPNRPTVDHPLADRPLEPAYDRPERSDGMGWGIIAGIAAVACIFGFLFFANPNDRTTTAANDAPASRQVNPSTPTPAPAPTPPTKTQ